MDPAPVKFPRYPAQYDNGKRPYGEPEAVYVALGSNLGDRAVNLRTALERIGETETVAAISGVYETEPWGVPDEQPAYLNQVCELQTSTSANDLMNLLLGIEADLGRKRTFQNEARPMDLDILFYGDRVIDIPGLQIPHPRLHERAFVLAPLAEIAPDLIHPIRGTTPGDLLRDVDASGVQKYVPNPADVIASD
ncbi:MAG: 2-amino-4-hydroxy-6-hydroxymethyldihydropteridine diphosphokinase [Chloroflexi bacterium]|nr:2-amino-4-hydroxy-6-hydroxymethyldihydropteridine diphosphokinase [Chloroflexota bacterium]